MKRAAEELRTLALTELDQKIDEMRRTLFSLKLNATTSHVKNVSQFKKLRRDIARGLTVLNEKKRIEFLKSLFGAINAEFDALNSEKEQVHE